MNPEYEYLPYLLGCYVRGTIPECRRDVDWRKLSDLAQVHQVLGVLGYMDMNHHLCPDAAVSENLRKTTLETMLRYSRLGGLCAELSGKFREQGIDHVLMKGAVVRDYFPVPELRTFGDVDFLIHEEDREKSHRLLVDAGFTPKVDWGPVYGYGRGAEFCEIHTQIMEVNVSDRADYRGYFDRAWENAVPRGDGTWEFTREFHFLYLLTHIAKHIRGSGAGIRMYLDLAACILHFGEAFDWDWLKAQLETLALMDFAQVAMTAVERWFGVSCPLVNTAMPGELLERFQIYTMEAGLYGHFQREQGSSVLRRAGELDPASRVELVLERLFPDAESLEARYTYLQGKHWLLPAAWIHRLIITRGKLGQHTQEAQQILSADEQKVLWLRKLCQDIGL